MRQVAAAVVVVVLGCAGSSDSFPIAETDASTPQEDAAGGSDTGPDTPNDAGGSDTGPDTPSDACAVEYGVTACKKVLQAKCERIVACCNGGGSCRSECFFPVSSEDTCDVARCKARLTRTGGYDCDVGSKWGKWICASLTNACVAAQPTVACSDILSATAVDPPACKTWRAAY